MKGETILKLISYMLNC